MRGLILPQESTGQDFGDSDGIQGGLRKRFPGSESDGIDKGDKNDATPEVRDRRGDWGLIHALEAFKSKVEALTLSSRKKPNKAKVTTKKPQNR